jgi:hypothetical protein
MRYICLDCGQIFDAPRKMTERHGLKDGLFEQTCGCPGCGGAYVETIICSVCLEPITDEYIKTSDGQTICSECYTKCQFGVD